MRYTDLKRWWVYQLYTYDCDPNIYQLKYIIQRMELNLEQRYWLCWLYANSYQVPTAWVLFNEFPDYQFADADRMERWNSTVKSRLPYQKDQKWLRGRLAEIFRSYRSEVGEEQSTYFAQYRGDFPRLWDRILKHFHRFGRYTAWMYLQALEEIIGLDLEPPDLAFGHDSSWAHRAGACRALGRDDWAQDKERRWDKGELEELDAMCTQLVEEVRREHPDLQAIRADRFSLETSLCSFSKLFRRERGRYLGYYLDRAAEDIIKTSSHDWPGIHWELLWESRTEILLPELQHNSVDKSKYSCYLDTGEFHPDQQLLERLRRHCNA